MKIPFLLSLCVCTSLAQDAFDADPWDADEPVRPFIITVETVVFRVPAGDLKTLGIESEKAANPLALFRTLVLRVEDKKALIVGQARVSSQSGLTVSSSSGEELIYPRAYQPLQKESDGRGYPTENRMTKMGVVLTARPQALSKKEVQVELDLTCDIAMPDPVDYEKALATTVKAGAPVSNVPEPGFQRHHIKEFVNLASGGAALLAVKSLPKSLDAKSAYRDLILLRAAVHH